MVCVIILEISFFEKLWFDVDLKVFFLYLWEIVDCIFESVLFIIVFFLLEICLYWVGFFCLIEDFFLNVLVSFV